MKSLITLRFAKSKPWLRIWSYCKSKPKIHQNKFLARVWTNKNKSAKTISSPFIKNKPWVSITTLFTSSVKPAYPSRLGTMKSTLSWIGDTTSGRGGRRPGAEIRQGLSGCYFREFELEVSDLILILLRTFKHLSTPPFFNVLFLVVEAFEFHGSWKGGDMTWLNFYVFIHYSFKSERYFGKENEKVRRTRMVSMIPWESPSLEGTYLNGRLFFLSPLPPFLF